MSQLKNIVKQVFSIYTIQIVEFITAFLLFIVLTRNLSQNDFGVYSILNITILFITGISCLGLNNFIIKDLTDKKDSVKQKRFSNLFSFMVLLCVGVSVALLLLVFSTKDIPKITKMFPNHLAIMAVFIIVFTICGNILSYYFFTKKESHKSTFSEIALKNVWILPILLVSLYSTINNDTIFGFRLFFTALFFMGLYFVIRKFRLITFNIDWKYIKKAIIFGAPLATLTVTQWIITAADRYMLGAYHSNESVAQYTYIYSLLNYILVFSYSAIITTLFPHIVDAYKKGKKMESNYYTNSALKYTLFFIVPLLLGFVLISNEVTELISGTKYLSSLALIPYLLIFPISEAFNGILRKVLVLHNKTKQIGLIYLFGAILNVVLNFLFIPKYNIFGAAISTSITYLSLLIFFFISTYKYLKLNLSFISPYKIIICGFTMYIVLINLNLHVIFKILLGATIYLGLAHLLGLFKSNS